MGRNDRADNNEELTCSKETQLSSKALVTTYTNYTTSFSTRVAAKTIVLESFAFVHEF